VRAIEYSVTGEPDVLTLVDRPLTEVGPGEVRVRIHRSGVNPTDWKSRRGNEAGTAVHPAQVPNQDGAGVVDAVGQGVDVALTGRRVWLWEAAYQRPAGGTAQEYAVVPVRHVMPLPDDASYDLGAALGVPFLTAHRCLTVTEDGPDRLGPGRLAGRTVLVAGGAGAVGNAAIQLARWSDATVITTVSGPEKGNLAGLAGADHVIDYKQQDVVAEVRAIAPGGVNTIVEVWPAASAPVGAAGTPPHGSVAVYATDGGPTTKELFEGLAEAYRREIKRRRHLEEARRRAPSPPHPQSPPVRALWPAAAESLTLKVMVLARMADLTMIFLATTGVTFVLSAVAILVR